jgi:hypothetical protein
MTLSMPLRANLPPPFDALLPYTQSIPKVDTKWDQDLDTIDSSISHLPDPEGFINARILDRNGQPITSITTMYSYYEDGTDSITFEITFVFAMVKLLTNDKKDFGKRLPIGVKLALKAVKEDTKWFMTNTSLVLPLYYLNLWFNLNLNLQSIERNVQITDNSGPAIEDTNPQMEVTSNWFIKRS